jgi:pimeloyl-ACP methyl ester carboxylesterase
MSVIVLDREIMHYEVLGRGRPIIFLHGWVGSWRYWIPTMQAVCVSFRAYALDLWGFGDSAKNAQRYTLDQQVVLLDQFMEQMGIARVALVGHGLGALVALMYTLNRPEYIDRLMAVSLPLDPGMLNSRIRTAGPGELADWLLGQFPSTEPARVDAPRTDAQALQISVSNLQSLNLREKIKWMQTACLLVNGQNDPAVAPPKLDDSLSLPAQSHSILFEQSGHFPMLDEGSKFNRLLTDFLALESGLSPRELQLKEEWKRRVR